MSEVHSTSDNLLSDHHVSYGTVTQMRQPAPRLLTSLELIGLTIGLTGLQFTWTVELAYGTPYLLSLGLPEFLMSLVWIAGPLSGLVVQPIVGCISDRSTNPFGRRRPVLIIGLILSLLAMSLVAYSKELASFFVSESGEIKSRVCIGFAVVGFYMLDFCINAVQAGLRALVLDVAPLQAELANAYASRMIGLGNIIGYLFGFIDLLSVFPWLGDSQMKVICIISSLVFISGIALTCISVKEIPYIAEPLQESWVTFTINVFKRIYNGLWKLPSSLQSVCNVQFLVWIGWFPFLFYSTTWMAEVLGRTMDTSDPNFLTLATQLGSFGFFLYSLISFSSSIILPLLITSETVCNNSLEPRQNHDLGNEAEFYELKKKFTLRNLYIIAHFLFAGLMFSTGLVNNSNQAIVIIALSGIPWCIILWAPYSLLSDFANFSTPESDETLLSSSENPHVLDSGLILGIHNIYIVAPQFLVNFFSSIVFYIVQSSQKGYSPLFEKLSIHRMPSVACAAFEFPSIFTSQQHAILYFTTLAPEPVGFILRLGGFSSLIAGFLAMRIPAPVPDSAIDNEA